MTMTVADPTALVGFAAFDRAGEELGEVEGVYLGADEPEWAAVLVDGLFVIVPLVDANLYEDSLDVPFTAAKVRAAPLQQEELLEDLTETQEDMLVAYYAHAGDDEVDDADDGDTGLREAGTEVAATARHQGQEVAATAKEHGQEVAASAREQGQRVASTARQQGQEVLRATADHAGEVVGTAKEQAGEVAQQASAQARDLFEETRARVEDQTAASAHTLGEHLSRLGSEALALADGRPDDAPSVRRYVRRTGENLLDAADRAYGISDDVRDRGIGGLLSDVQSFARRRPGVFLLGTAAVGVLAGRAVRNAKEDDGGAAPAPALPRATNAQRPAARAGTRGVR